VAIVDEVGVVEETGNQGVPVAHDAQAAPRQREHIQELQIQDNEVVMTNGTSGPHAAGPSRTLTFFYGMVKGAVDSGIITHREEKD
jgi:hypothetical protein